MLDKGKHFLLLTVSTLIMAIGTYFFKFTNNFTFGGITGLAVLIAKTGLMTAGDFNFVASMTLLVIGMIVLGKKFAAKTAYCSILLSVTLSFLERVCPMKAPLTDQPMLELCFAIALPALGSHYCRILYLRYQNWIIFFARTYDSFFHGRHLYRELQFVQIF